MSFLLHSYFFNNSVSCEMWVVLGAFWYRSESTKLPLWQPLDVLTPQCSHKPICHHTLMVLSACWGSSVIKWFSLWKIRTTYSDINFHFDMLCFSLNFINGNINNNMKHVKYFYIHPAFNIFLRIYYFESIGHAIGGRTFF